MAVLEIDGVTKIYKSKGRTVTAAEDVSFTVDKGEIVGFIGQNGAGKSTTLKIVTGLAYPTSGSVRINGYDIKKDRVKALEKVGCIIENPDLYREWSAMKNLEYCAALSHSEKFGKGAERKENIKKRSEDLLKLVGVFDRRNDPIRKYSLGMKQRVGIAQALLAYPDLLILDEPTNGLDPNGIMEVRDILRKISKEYGMAVLVSSHLLSEIQAMCDKYVIIDKGRVTGVFTAAFVASVGDETKIILTTDDVIKARDALKNEMQLDSTILGNGKIEFATEKSVGDVTKDLIMNGINVLGITRKETTLEEFFMNVTHSSEGDEGGKNE